jgi:hypothetical protein
MKTNNTADSYCVEGGGRAWNDHDRYVAAAFEFALSLALVASFDDEGRGLEF